MNPEDGSRLLAEGGVDAIVVWEPLAHLARKALGTEARVIPHERIYTESFNALVLRAFAAKNPAILDSFARALADAIEFIHADPKESQRIVAARIGQDLALVGAVWQDFDFGLSLHQWLLTTLENEARWAIGKGLVSADEAPNYLDFIDTSVLDRVHREVVTIYR